MRSSSSLVLVLALSACGSPERQAPQAQPPLPLGVWEVADVNEAAQELLPAWRGAFGEEFITFERGAVTGPNKPLTDKETLAQQMPNLSSTLLEFRADGTTASTSKFTPWSTGTWKRDGDSIALTVDRTGPHVWGGPQSSLPPFILEFRVSGEALVMTVFDHPIRLRRSSHGPLVQPKSD